jgi:multidrug efflux pump
VFSHYFIERPIFAAVLSIVIALAGAVAAVNLPVAQFPQITPPSITVSCTYPGANAKVVAESVAAPIEQQVNGVEGMMYMSSQSANDGTYSLTVTFKPGVNLNFAQVLVQNRVNLAMPMLPDVVKQAGVTTRKRNPDILQIISVYSPKARYGHLYVSNFTSMRVRDEIARVDGVGETFIFGTSDYSMRVWVDPEKLAALNLTSQDVVNAVREQNMQVAAGHFGQPPGDDGQPFEFTITTLGRLSEPEEFENIILRTDEGRIVRIKDVGTVVLGARNEDISCKISGKDGVGSNRPCVGLVVYQLPYANSMATAERVRGKMRELKKQFPDDIDYVIGYDNSPFIEESIHEVFRTLAEAVILVAIVVLVFLQNWRSTLIPLIAVPVAILGTFGAMAAVGFTLNNLTLFGLVLAIGIVVDDAIVVVEAIERHIEHGLEPRAAAHRAMAEVSGPVVAVALVLSAVFVPCAFISGITGQFFRQFALTIAVSTVISAFNSLTLSPALAALLLQPRGARKDVVGRGLDLVLGWFFRLFNRGFGRTTDAYTRAVNLGLRGSAVALAVYGGLVVVTGWLSSHLPTGYIPNQDQGKLYVAVQLPDATSLERTQKTVDRIALIVKSEPGVAYCTAVTGQSHTLGANGSNFGNLFVTLEGFHDRREAALSSEAIAARLRARLAAEIPEANTAVLGPPPVAGLGSSGGFKIILEDRSDSGLAELQKQAERLIAAGKPDPNDPATLEPDAPQQKVQTLFTVFRANTPQLHVDLNRDQCETMGVNPRDVFATLQIYLGSLYVNDFNRFGRTWQVVVQARGEFRNDPDKIKLLQVRNKKGEMVPLGAVLSLQEVGGPMLISRYNMYPSAVVVGSTRPGVSTGEGIAAVEQLCDETLPDTMGYEWTEISFLQVEAGKSVWNNLIFPLAVVFVFLVLAAQYESFALPLAVILVVPMCILGSLIGVAVTHSDVNIFTQIGFVVLVGLASKNAILIVEFAKHKREGGLPRREATLEACRLRLRPILMTSFAFILGAVPLLLSNGAGAEMRRTLGTAVFSGMLGVTLFGIFLTPVFFYVIEGFIEIPLFSSERARLVGQAAWFTLGAATLGLLWLPAMMTRRLSRRYGVVVVPAVNGKGFSEPEALATVKGVPDADAVDSAQP